MPWKKGQSGNPGGICKREAQERDAARKLLLTEERDVRWRDAYDAEIEKGNSVILVDYGNRRLGKPVDLLAEVDAEGNDLHLTPEKRLAYLDACLAWEKAHR